MARRSQELAEAAHALLTGEDSISEQDELAGVGLALLALWCEQWLKREWPRDGVFTQSRQWVQGCLLQNQNQSP